MYYTKSDTFVGTISIYKYMLWLSGCLDRDTSFGGYLPEIALEYCCLYQSPAASGLHKLLAINSLRVIKQLLTTL